ncbi:hypothetical protein BKA14_007911 [Actinoplanes abujensis]|uniref:Uncharacterized protein n=1 Tax=Paractinoplanes abujensis TaxID=882441 RepID=A0A7W7G4V7_9ACTN|nr:hypothetical protein [Actinoplanes abujensis]
MTSTPMPAPPGHRSSPANHPGRRGGACRHETVRPVVTGTVVPRRPAPGKAQLGRHEAAWRREIRPSAARSRLAPGDPTLGGTKPPGAGRSDPRRHEAAWRRKIRRSAARSRLAPRDPILGGTKPPGAAKPTARANPARPRRNPTTSQQSPQSRADSAPRHDDRHRARSRKPHNIATRPSPGGACCAQQKAQRRRLRSPHHVATKPPPAGSRKCIPARRSSPCAQPKAPAHSRSHRAGPVACSRRLGGAALEARTTSRRSPHQPAVGSARRHDDPHRVRRRKPTTFAAQPHRAGPAACRSATSEGHQKKRTRVAAANSRGGRAPAARWTRIEPGRGTAADPRGVSWCRLPVSKTLQPRLELSAACVDLG